MVKLAVEVNSPERIAIRIDKDISTTQVKAFAFFTNQYGILA